MNIALFTAKKGKLLNLIGDELRDILEVGETLLINIEVVKKPIIDICLNQGQKTGLNKVLVESMSIRPRIKRLLDRCGLVTLGQLSRAKEDDLWTIDGMGPNLFSELSQAFAKEGLSFNTPLSIDEEERVLILSHRLSDRAGEAYSKSDQRQDLETLPFWFYLDPPSDVIITLGDLVEKSDKLKDFVKSLVDKDGKEYELTFNGQMKAIERFVTRMAL